jgi:dTDP-4-dehydrorhamnose 3,5-epimerase
MRFSASSLAGVWLIDLELRQDDRGFFARSYCDREFSAHELNTSWPQCNVSFTRRRGMVRGMHFQAEPKPEIKLVRCTAGAVLDVVVDVRRGSPSYGKWEAFELTALNRRALYIPAGFAHGFQCLADDCEMFYQMSEVYFPELARGLRWNDPAVGIAWPIADAVLSDRDQGLPLLAELT